MPRVTVEAALNATKFESGIHSIKNSLSSLKGYIGSYLGFEAVKGGIEHIVAAADAVDKTSLRLKISTDYAQALAIEAEHAGSSLENVEKALRKVESARGTALGGSAKEKNAFAGLGISETELQNEDKIKLLQKITLAASQGTTQTQGKALADLGFKGVAGDLIAIGDSIQDLDRKTAELKSKGMIMDDEDITRLVAAKDEWMDITKQIDVAGTSIVSKWMVGIEAAWYAIESVLSNVFGFIESEFDLIKQKVIAIVDAIQHPIKTIEKGGLGESLLSATLGNAKTAFSSTKDDIATSWGEMVDKQNKEAERRKKLRDNGGDELGLDDLEKAPKGIKPYSDALTQGANMLGASYTNMNRLADQMQVEKQQLEEVKKVTGLNQQQVELLKTISQNIMPKGMTNWMNNF